MDSIHLIGAEDIRSAGYTMQHAADSMRQAASAIEDTFQQYRRFMDDWLSRFEAALEKAKDKTSFMATAGGAEGGW